MFVPDGANPSSGYTADVGPVHSSGGVMLEHNGSEIQVWRSPEYPSDADTANVEVKPAGIGSQWFFVRSGFPELNRCILGSLSYDQALDEADD